MRRARYSVLFLVGVGLCIAPGCSGPAQDGTSSSEGAPGGSADSGGGDDAPAHESDAAPLDASAGEAGSTDVAVPPRDGGSPAADGGHPGSLYGMHWRMESLGNLSIGSNDDFDRVSFRIRAQHTGEVDSIAAYWMLAVYPTYTSGSGGIVRVELQADDGTPQHFPSGTALASFQENADGDESTKSFNSAFGSPDNGCAFGRMYFDHPVAVTAGQLYHVVFSNPATDTVNNYWSVDCIFNSHPTSPMQPGYGDTDLAALVHHLGGAWENPGNPPPSTPDPAGDFTPIYTLFWTDGSVQGQTYLQLGYPLGLAGYPIYGATHMVRQKLVVSGAPRTVTDVNVNLYKTGSPPDATVEVQDASFNTIAGGTIAASSVSPAQSDPGWATAMLANPVTLNVGSTYYVKVSAPGGDGSDAYFTWSAEDGYNYGLRASPDDAFADGEQSGNYGYYMTDGSTWETNHDNLMIFFHVQ